MIKTEMIRYGYVGCHATFRRARQFRLISHQDIEGLCYALNAQTCHVHLPLDARIRES